MLLLWGSSQPIYHTPRKGRADRRIDEDEIIILLWWWYLTGGLG